MSELKLPKDDRSIEVYRLSGTPVAVEKRSAADFNRVAFAAAHVVADPLADNDPWLTPRSIGTRPCGSVIAFGTSASGSRKRWTRLSAAWGWHGRRPRS